MYTFKSGLESFALESIKKVSFFVNSLLLIYRNMGLGQLVELQIKVETTLERIIYINLMKVC